MMKKRYGWKLLVLAALMALLAVGCSKSSKLPEGFTEDVYQPYLDMLAKKGDFEAFGKTAFVGQEKDGQKYAAVIYVVKHAEGEIKYTVGYDEDMKLVQFVAQ